MSNGKDKKAKTPLKVRILAEQYAALISESDFKTPEEFDVWLKELNQEKRHCVQMTLAATRIFTKLAAAKLNEMPDDALLASKYNDYFAGMLKLISYKIIYEFKKGLATNHGELKAGRNELKGSPRNIKCDCLLNPHES